MPHRAPPVVLIVELLAGQFDPLHCRTATGERGEHLRGPRGIDRSQRMPGPRGDGDRISIHFGCGENRRVGGSVLRFRIRSTRVGLPAVIAPSRRVGTGIGLGRGTGEEPLLEKLTGEEDREDNQQKLEMTTFHDHLSSVALSSGEKASSAANRDTDQSERRGRRLRPRAAWGDPPDNGLAEAGEPSPTCHRPPVQYSPDRRRRIIRTSWGVPPGRDRLQRPWRSLSPR